MTVGQTLIHARAGNEKILLVQFTLGNTCTYACSYCPPQLHAGTEKWLDYEKIVTFMRALRTTHEFDGKKIYVEFTGGEPTLFPHFVQLVRELSSLDLLIGLNSNGSVKLSIYEQLVQSLQQVTLTYHVENAKFDHFRDVLRIFAGRIKTHVNLTCIPGRTEESHATARRLHQEFPQISCNLKVLRKQLQHELFEYEEEELELMKSPFHSNWNRNIEVRGAMQFDTGEILGPNQIILRGRNRFKNWLCHVGLECLVVDMRGTIYRGICKAGGSLGNIQDGTFTIPKEPIRCPFESCKCALDVMVSKFEKDEARLTGQSIVK